jgi:hypothetical protein
MKLSKLFVIALLVGTLAAIGCGDSGSSNGGNGNGNGSVCDDCENQSDIGLCEASYNRCILTNPNEGECAAGALLTCEVV